MKIIFMLVLSLPAFVYAQNRVLSVSKGKLTADVFVQGSYTAMAGAKVKTKWFKVSGLKSTIQTPDSLGTNILALSKGTYEFGFIVTDITHNLADTDYMKIFVK